MLGHKHCLYVIWVFIKSPQHQLFGKVAQEPKSLKTIKFWAEKKNNNICVLIQPQSFVYCQLTFSAFGTKITAGKITMLKKYYLKTVVVRTKRKYE